MSASEVDREVPPEEFVEVPKGVGLTPSIDDSTLPHNQLASDSPTWSFVDAQPSQNDASPGWEYDSCLVKPLFTSEPHGRPGLDHLVDYRGARGYWKDTADFDALDEQIGKLKLDHRSICGASRELFKKQENQLHDLQTARWEICCLSRRSRDAYRQAEE